ncbi:MAG: polymer-forming cytoskeletal protein, partial [Dehalococcoidia bacterium]|nr:polymer-forming cytoskeletal protein [Dehalococcoidia bacterium]
MTRRYVAARVLLTLGLLAGALLQNGCSNERQQEGRLIVGYTDPDQVFVIDANTVLHQEGDIGVVGNGTLLIDGGTLHLTGQLYIAQNATVIVDGGELHIHGNDTNIYVRDSGKLIVRNKSLLHYVQSYVAQHNIIAWGDGHVELRDCRVDCDNSIEFICMTENASYEAVNVEYHHWKTWYLWNTSSLTLENVNLAGDIVFYDSPTMSFKNTNVIMPWLYLGEGATVDCQFPTPASAHSPMTVTLKDGVEGFSGIPWSLNIEDCRYIAWGVNPYPGSDVTVRNSNLTMVMFRFLGDATFDLKEMMVAESHYDDLRIPVSDRKFRLVDTTVKWWKVDTCDS